MTNQFKNVFAFGRFLWRRRRRGRPYGGGDALLGAAIEGLSAEVMDELAARSEFSADAARAYAIALQKVGREAEAQRFLDDACLSYPEHTGLRFQADALARHRYEPLSQAYALIKLGDVDQAREAFASALKLVGRRLPAEALTSVLCGAGWVEMSAGLPQVALDFFQRAARVDPRHMDAFHGTASAYRAMGERRTARPIFGHAANLNKMAPAPLALIGWCHYEEGNYGAASRAFGAAMGRNSLDLESAWGWAWSLWRNNDVDTVSAFAAACAVGWHASGPDLLIFAKKDRRLGELLPLIVESSWAVSPYVSEEAASAWLDTEPEDLLACAQVFRRSGLHDLLIDWVLDNKHRGSLGAEALRSAIGIKRIDAIAPLIELAKESCPPGILGEAEELLGNSEAAREAFKAAIQGGDLSAPKALENLERRLRFAPLSSTYAPNESHQGSLADDARNLLHVRRLLDEGCQEEAIKNLKKTSGIRALELLETVEATEHPKTAVGALASHLAGHTPQLSGFPPSVHLSVLRVLKKGQGKGQLSRRQVRNVIKYARRDPEDRVLSKAVRQALSLLSR